jgi:hypothetical protein
MSGALQTIFAAVSMIASLLVFVVNQQIRSEVIVMKVEMLDRLENLRQQNDRIYPRRENLESLERRVNQLESRNARPLER